MEKICKGYVIINENHPSGTAPFVAESTFRTTKKRTIADFIKNTNSEWRYWYRKYNFRCVKAESKITIKKD